jgi:hypothetical protein
MAVRDESHDVFFAYASKPPLVAECMRGAAERLANRGISARTWQQLPIEGRLLIGQVLTAIDGSSVVIAEVGSLNSNVLFEVGFAIARDKHIWLVLDETDTAATAAWRDLGLFANVGRVDYGGNSETLTHKFFQARPDLDAAETLWADLFSTIHSPREPKSIFVLPTLINDDASRTVRLTLDQRPSLAVHRAEDDERGLAPLAWYVNQIYRSSATLVHLLSPTKERAAVHNARASLLAGIAHGLERPILLLAPDDLPVPLDYREMLHAYETTHSLSRRLSTWLDALPATAGQRRQPGRAKLSVEIPVSFGEYVAEDERQDLPEYFIPTGEYAAVMRGGTAVFVGRKGTGKTATMLRATDELMHDKRNLVVPIKPSGYELEGVVEVIKALPDRASVDYFLEGLWRYLLFCEIAAAAVREAEDKAAGIANGSAMFDLRALLTEREIAVEGGFAVRLESLVKGLLNDMKSMPTTVGEVRNWLNQRLNTASLPELREHIAAAVYDRSRVAILIDNLDKAWERGADYERLARLIFGLLTAVGRVSSDFAREANNQVAVKVTLAVFLRADIFSVVRKYAREPDKIKTLQISWDDPALLARVLEDRYVAAKGPGTQPDELWTDFFCRSVEGMDTRAYLLWRCLSRPRDLVYLCNGAVMSATNARRSLIEAADVRQAEREYSQFAFEALLVESDPHAGLANLLIEFAGCSSTLSREQVYTTMSAAGHAGQEESRLSELLRASFLGIEIADGRFDYPPTETAELRSHVLSRKFEHESGRPARFRVHPAYRPYLEIDDDDLPSRQEGAATAS